MVFEGSDDFGCTIPRRIGHPVELGAIAGGEEEVLREESGDVGGRRPRSGEAFPNPRRRGAMIESDHEEVHAEKIALPHHGDKAIFDASGVR